MGKLSSLPEDITPATTDFAIGVNSGPTDSKFKFSNLIALFFNNIPNTVIAAASLIGTKIWGVDNALYGTQPTSAGQFYTQAGTFISNTNSAGDATYSFPLPFPNGVQTIILTQGDVTGGQVAFEIIQSTVSVSQFSFQCGAPNTTVRVNYIAIGF